jgi:mycothiol synthase
MTAALDLGLTTRAATTDDAYPIYRLIAECELDLDGQAEVDPDDLVSDLARPALDLARDTVLLHDPPGELVGWAHVFKGTRAEADVRPQHRGRGLGTWLLRWTEARARETGAEKVGQTVTDHNRAAAELFRAHGYEPKDTAWILSIALDAQPPVPDPPGAITVRSYQPGRDDEAAHRLIDEAFCEWPDRDPVPFDDWAAVVIRRETFAPALSGLAFDGDRLVGAALAPDYRDEHEGYVHQLAVHRDYRERGIARALLHHTFAGFHRTGRRAVCLSTNSYTGALSLYERVGMRIRRSYTHYEKRLTGPAGAP